MSQPADDERAGRSAPGTPQTELLRRITALHEARALPEADRLARQVLDSTSPGRGLVDPGPDAGGLPASEVIRASIGVLVPLLLSAPAAGRTQGRTSGRTQGRARLGRRLTGHGFVVHGSPVLADGVRDALHRDGWPLGGRRAVHVVLGQDLETMMLEQWHARVAAGSERRWRPLWRRWQTLDELPPRLRLAERATELARAHGAERVHVALGAESVAEVAGAQLASAGHADPEATDLLRRLNPFLVMRGGALGRDAAMGTWDDALAAVRATHPGSPLGAPPGMVPWARRAAEELAAALAAGQSRGDYAVHGDPASLVPPRSAPGRERTPDPDRVADLAVRLIAELWHLNPTGGTG